MRPDHMLQEAVQQQLDFEPSIDASHIGVVARDGVVTLTGRVGSRAERATAERVACSVKGVKAVVDGITVELPGERRTSDEQLAERAYARLASNVSVPLDRIKLAVRDGVVTLRGDVDWQYQRQAALQDLHHLPGLRDVQDEIAIKPPVEAVAVHDKIRDALARITLVEADNVRVEVKGSVVTLSGQVASWHEKGIAESTAWSVPGVSRVDNHITVV